MPIRGEPHFPHPLPSPETVDAVLERLNAPDAAWDSRLDAFVRSAFDLPFDEEKRPAYDLTDALDLVAEVLPGWSVDMQTGRLPDDRSVAELGGEGPFLYASVSQWLGGATFKPLTPPNVGRTKSLSVCLALFTALKAYEANLAHYRAVYGEPVG